MVCVCVLHRHPISQRHSEIWMDIWYQSPADRRQRCIGMKLCTFDCVNDKEGDRGPISVYAGKQLKLLQAETRMTHWRKWVHACTFVVVSLCACAVQVNEWLLTQWCACDNPWQGQRKIKVKYMTVGLDCWKTLHRDVGLTVAFVQELNVVNKCINKSLKRSLVLLLAPVCDYFRNTVIL